MYAKISISIYVGIITLNIYSRMTYVSIQNWAREPSFKSLGYHFYFFIYYIIIHRLGDQRSNPNSFILFSLIFLFIFFSLGLRRIGIEHPQPHFLFISFSLMSLLFGRGGVGSNPHIPTMIFSP